MVNKKSWCAVLLILVMIQVSLSGSGAAQAEKAASHEKPYFQNMDLFQSGAEGYHTFRIPSLLTTSSGTLLAFAEGRKNSASDTGNIDVVLKRSLDGGLSWKPLQNICDAGTDTCGNPTAVQDEDTGRIWLFLTQNYGEDTLETIVNGTSRGVRTIWSSYSDDDGMSWSKPVNRFHEVQQPNTRWDATGPGTGIQLKLGPAKGRLIIPAIGRNIQSDDHGATWYESGRLPDGLSESTIVELTNGTLMRNDRLSSHQEKKSRGISLSMDQGTTWSGITYDQELIDPICEASLIRYLPSDNNAGDKRLLFSNPADQNQRQNMTVRLSRDDGGTWAVAKTVYRGNAAYSSLYALPDGKVGLLFEGGLYTAYDKIMFAVFNPAWLATPEPDLEQLVFSEGTLSPVFRGDIGEYKLNVFSDTEQVTITPIAARSDIEVTINNKPVVPDVPATLSLNGLNSIAVEASLGQRVRHYTVDIDRSRPRPELLLRYDFNQTSRSEIQDVTGKGHTGLLHNGAVLRPGLEGNALYLNGNRSNVELTNTDDLHTGTGDFAFTVWVNPDQLIQQRHIIYWYGKANKYPQWWFAVEKNGAVRMNMYGVPANQEVGVATAGGLVKPGEWTHLAAVREGSVNKIYVNGALAATSVKYDGSTMNITNRDEAPLVGYDKGTPANRDWFGLLDDLRLYKNALSESEIKQLYADRGGSTK